MLQKKEDIGKLKENWPEHYYEIDDVLLRRQLLEEHPSQEESRTLLEIWGRRFSEKNRRVYDHFMEAWLMLKIASQSKVGFLNRRGKEKEIRKYAEMLCLSDPSADMKREWRDFARTLLISCADTRAYRTALFGMIDLGDRVTAMRIAEEIDTVTGIYPDSLGCRELFQPLREVMIQTYRDILNAGNALWNEYEGK